MRQVGRVRATDEVLVELVVDGAVGATTIETGMSAWRPANLTIDIGFDVDRR